MNKNIAKNDTPTEKLNLHATPGRPINDGGETEYQKWVEKEELFSLNQVIEKSRIRLSQGRGLEIDFFTSILHDHKSDIPAPGVGTFKYATREQLDDSINLVETFKQLKRYDSESEYLDALLLLLKARRDANVSMHVTEDLANKIDEILCKRTQDELEAYKLEIQKRFKDGQIVDENFWEAVLAKIPIFEAIKKIETRLYKPRVLVDPSLNCKVDLESFKNKENEDILTVKEDIENRKALAEDILAKLKLKSRKSTDAERFERFVAGIKLEEDEHVMTDVIVPKEAEFGLRSPRFYARIKTGYEWTRYNQVHYDSQNLPPKLVQGYKFTIFYPDLVDPSKVPKWRLEKDPDQTSKSASGPHDACIIRFTASEPYQDIAFKIINKEWDTEPSRGFKNYFDNGILHLHFSFRRVRYRR